MKCYTFVLCTQSETFLPVHLTDSVRIAITPLSVVSMSLLEVELITNVNDKMFDRLLYTFEA